jgi:hypothetical protein
VVVAVVAVVLVVPVVPVVLPIVVLVVTVRQKILLLFSFFFLGLFFSDLF